MRSSWKPRHHAVLFLLCLAAPAFLCLGARAASVNATVDRQIVPLGEELVLTLAFEGGSPPSAPGLPALPNLQVTGTSTESSFTMVNGQTTSTVKFNYALQPTQVGDLVIPSLQFRLNGQMLSTQPLRVKVVQGAAPGGPESDPNQTAFLKMLVPKKTVYQGEVLPLELHLYVQAAREPQMPQLQAQGFTVGAMQQLPQRRTQVGNRLFVIAPFRTFAIPARAGPLPLGPATMNLQIPRPNARRDFFGEIVDWRQATLTTDPETITVLPLPATGAPDTFNGAVGQFSLAVTAGPTNLAAGDPITLKATLTGRGYLDGLRLPDQPGWREFKVYPPTSTVNSSDPQHLNGSKTFEQVLVPSNHEITVLPPLQFSYFDVDRGSYVTLTNAPLPLVIRPAGTQAPPPQFITNTTGTAAAEAPADDILHIKPRLDDLAAAGAPRVRQGWFLALQLVPPLCWLALLLRRRQRELLAGNPRLRRRREVEQKVREGLPELRRLAESGSGEAFFAALFRLLQEQLGERLDLPASAITESVLTERLAPDQLPEGTLTGLHELFQACNQARYASTGSPADLGACLARAETVFAELRSLKA